ncbi:hypothetical protein B0H17DRAFT_1282872 [Mycena rosella]|uniref:Uncharacterized protein n=1 Tax=Mycena rosella TaxID=1033263 RepID=A0AAD7FPY2_MYCRO|nr:hypothetical protein B0H17DRAFT_1282872 [Mycena rosella]
MSTQQSTGYHTRARTGSGQATPPPPIYGPSPASPSPEVHSSPRPASLDAQSETAGHPDASPKHGLSGADPERGVFASGNSPSTEYPLTEFPSFNDEGGIASGPDEGADDGGWTPVTRRTARTHSPRSNSPLHNNIVSNTPNANITVSTDDIASDSTVARATQEMSSEDLVAIAERYEALAAAARVDLARKTREQTNKSGETAGETGGNSYLFGSVKFDTGPRGKEYSREDQGGSSDRQPNSPPPKVSFSKDEGTENKNAPASDRLTHKGDGDKSGQTNPEIAGMKQQLEELKQMLKASQTPAPPSERKKAQRVVDKLTSEKNKHRATPRRLAAQSFIAKAIRGVSKAVSDPPTPDPSDSSSEGSKESDAGSDSEESEGEKSAAASRHRRMSSRRSSATGGSKMRIRPKEPTAYDGSPNATAFHRLVREAKAYVGHGAAEAEIVVNLSRKPGAGQTSQPRAGGSSGNSGQPSNSHGGSSHSNAYTRPQRGGFRGRGRGRGGRGFGSPRVLYSELALEIAQPFPGEDDVQEGNRFLVYATTETQYVIMDNRTGEDVLIEAESLEDPLFQIGFWYACKRQAALGLNPFQVESTKRYCVDNPDALLVAIETLLDGAHGTSSRFRVTELNEDTLTILDLGWNMSADIPKEFLRNRAFDLFSWFELNAKEVRDEEPRSPSVLGSEPEMVSSDTDFEYLTDCTDPDMPALMDADSDSDSEDGYSTDDTEEKYLSDGTDPEMPPLEQIPELDNSEDEDCDGTKPWRLNGHLRCAVGKWIYSDPSSRRLSLGYVFSKVQWGGALEWHQEVEQ